MSTLSANLLSCQCLLCLNGVYPVPYSEWPIPCYRTKPAGHSITSFIPSKRPTGSSYLPLLSSITSLFGFFLKILCRVDNDLKINHADRQDNFHYLTLGFTIEGNFVCIKKEETGINAGSFDLLATLLQGPEASFTKMVILK